VHSRPLSEATWPDFAALVERHNGVWGGCWCMGFHEEGVGRHKTPAQNRSEKECRVREGRAHAALVYDGDTCVGWCQFGSPDELPRIKHRRAGRCEQHGARGRVHHRGTAGGRAGANRRSEKWRRRRESRNAANESRVCAAQRHGRRQRRSPLGDIRG